MHMIWLTLAQNTSGVAAPARPWPATPAGAYVHLRRAFVRHAAWAADYARAGDVESAREAQMTADAICDELSDD